MFKDNFVITVVNILFCNIYNGEFIEQLSKFQLCYEITIKMTEDAAPQLNFQATRRQVVKVSQSLKLATNGSITSTATRIFMV